MQGNNYQYTTSEIELHFTRNERRTTPVTPPTTNASRLEYVCHGGGNVSSSEDRMTSLDETVPSTALDSEFPNAPLLEKHPEISRDWPTSPQPVKVSFLMTIRNVLVDIFLLALSLAFLAFALFVVWYNGKPTSHHPQAAERIQQASIWGPTIYPLLFASVVGRATFAVLLWRLERGERIGILDILASSSSLTSTVVSQFHLRAISCVGLGLIAIWTLSPVGGQSSFRQISYGPKDITEPANFFYVVPSQWLWTPDLTQIKPFLDISYLAALMSPSTAQDSPRDAWGHVKVPRIEHYEDTSMPGDEGWYSTENGTLESYSSFIGLPISGMEATEFIDYSTTIQAKYFHLACDLYDGKLQFIFNNSRWLGNVSWNENITERAATSPDEVEPFAFVITVDHFRPANCTIDTAYVEAEITCPAHDTCAAVRMRRSRLAHPPETYTQLGPLIGFKNTPWESALLDIADETGTVGESDEINGDDEVVESGEFGMALISQFYLADPNNVMGEMGPSTTKPSELGPDVFAIRLSQVINSYWATMNGKGSVTGVFDEFTNRSNTNISWYYEDQENIQSTDDQTFDDAFVNARAWPSTGTKRSNVEVFKAHYGWAIALIVSSTVLVAASLVPFCLRTFSSHGPDVLMNFSSLATRNNPYVALPVTGTYLDAADRSRLLKDVRIRFGDVESGNAIGMLGIGRLDGDVAPLRKERKYA